MRACARHAGRVRGKFRALTFWFGRDPLPEGAPGLIKQNLLREHFLSKIICVTDQISCLEGLTSLLVIRVRAPHAYHMQHLVVARAKRRRRVSASATRRYRC